MNDQMTIHGLLKEPARFYEAEWLKAKGFINIYDEPITEEGWYFFADIEKPTKTLILKAVKNFDQKYCSICLGNHAMGSFRPCWYKKIGKKNVDYEV